MNRRDGIPFNAANDLTFEPDGRLYFTDSGVLKVDVGVAGMPLFRGAIG